MKKYANSTPDSPTYYPTWKNVLDIFLHRKELPVDDVVSLDELNFDFNTVWLVIDCSKLTRMTQGIVIFGGMC